MPVADLVVRISTQIAEVQKDFASVKASTDKLATGFEGVNSKLATFGKAFAAVGGAAAIGGFAKSILDAAGNLVDLSNKTGLSLDTLQRFQHVASLTGTTVDAFSDAALKLGTNLAGGEKGVVAAVEALGLSFDALRKQSPDEQFRTVAGALESMVDPQKRNYVALELFGRLAKDLLPALAEGYTKLAAGAKVASDNQIKALDDAGDAWARFTDHAKNVATKIGGEVVIAFEKADKATLSWAEALHTGRTELELMQSVGDMQAKALKASPLPKLPGLSVPTHDIDAETRRLDAAIAAQKSALDKAARDVQSYRDSVRSLADEYSGARLAADVKKVSEAFGLLKKEGAATPAALKRIADAVVELHERGADLTPALRRVALEASAVTDTYMDLSAAFPPVDNGLRALEIHGWEVAGAFGKVNEQLKPLTLTARDVAGAFDHGSIKAIDMTATLRDLSHGLDGVARSTTGTVSVVTGGLADMAAAFAAFREGELTKAQRAMAAIQGVANVFAATGGSQTPGEGALSGAFAGASAGAMFGPWGAAAGAIGGAIVGAIRGTTEYEQRVRTAAESMRQLTNAAVEQAGGLDRLRAQFSVVGIQIDEAFRSRDPEWLRQVLNDGYERTRVLNEALVEYGLTWENLGAEGRAVHLGSAFDTLKEKTDVLKAAGVDYNLILEKQKGQYSELVQAAIRTGTEIPESMRPILEDLIAMGQLVREDGTAFTDLSEISWAKTMTQGFADVTVAIRELTKALTGGIGGALDELSKRRVRIPIGFDVDPLPTAPGGRVPVGGGSGFSGGGMTHTTVVEVDGETMARVTVPYIPGEMSRVGIS